MRTHVLKQLTRQVEEVEAELQQLARLREITGAKRTAAERFVEYLRARRRLADYAAELWTGLPIASA